MNFYKNIHQYYCGIDLHSRQMYLCIKDSEGNILTHKNMSASPDKLAEALFPYNEDDIVVGVENVFSWYWVEAFCSSKGIPFVLGHSAYIRRMYCGKGKNDRRDSEHIASLMRAGMFPTSFTYPKNMRSTRDLLRRRIYLTNKKAEFEAHSKILGLQNNLINANEFFASQFQANQKSALLINDALKANIDADVALTTAFKKKIYDIEVLIEKQSMHHDAKKIDILQSIPGTGKIISLVIFYEIGEIDRFPKLQNFLSYSDVIKVKAESAGKIYKNSDSKHGNQHLKWAFFQAAFHFLTSKQVNKIWVDEFIGNYGRQKGLSILAKKLATVVYYMLKRNEVFDIMRFMAL